MNKSNIYMYYILNFIFVSKYQREEGTNLTDLCRNVWIFLVIINKLFISSKISFIIIKTKRW